MAHRHLGKEICDLGPTRRFPRPASMHARTERHATPARGIQQTTAKRCPGQSRHRHLGNVPADAADAGQDTRANLD